MQTEIQPHVGNFEVTDTGLGLEFRVTAATGDVLCFTVTRADTVNFDRMPFESHESWLRRLISHKIHANHDTQEPQP